MNTTESATRPGPRGEVFINSRLCKGCGYCVESCVQGVLAISSDINERGYRYAHSISDACTGCGLCFYNCPEPAAITVRKEV